MFSSAFRTAALLTAVILGATEIIEDSTEISFQQILVCFYGGCAVAYVTSTLVFLYIFKRQLAVTIVMMTGVGLVAVCAYCMLTLIVPNYALKNKEVLPAWATFFTYGAIQSST